MTAFSTGTASNHSDLWTKLLTFLTSNSSLVAAGEAWTVAWSNGNQRVLKGPGLSAHDEVLVGLKLNADAAIDSYWIELRGMSGVLSGATDVGGHTNVSKKVGIYLDSQPFTYWFVANGRRFIVVLKISTVFQACYGGLILPYTTPLAYPYPLFVGGTRGDNPASPVNWRSVSDDHTMFFSPQYTFLGTRDSCAWMLDPAGQWVRCWNNGDDPGDPKIGMAPEQMFDGFGSDRVASPLTYGYDTIRKRMCAGFDGTFPLIDISLVQKTPTDQTYGVLDGVYRVAGVGNSSENLIAADGVNHLVVQNCFRTGTGEFIAVGLG